MGITIKQLLQKMNEVEASDLHIKVGSPPVLRVASKLIPFETDEMTAEETDALLSPLIPTGQREKLNELGGLDFSHMEGPHGRYRCSVFCAGGALHAATLPVEALVLESVYPTLEEAVVNRISMRLGSFLAPILSQLLLWQVEPILGFDPFKLNPIDRIGRVTAPILLIAGSEDRHTSLEESKALFEAAGQPKDLWVVKGAAHQGFHRFDRAEYERRVLEFFDEHLAAAAAHPEVGRSRRPSR